MGAAGPTPDFISVGFRPPASISATLISGLGLTVDPVNQARWGQVCPGDDSKFKCDERETKQRVTRSDIASDRLALFILSPGLAPCGRYLNTHSQGGVAMRLPGFRRTGVERCTLRLSWACPSGVTVASVQTHRLPGCGLAGPNEITASVLIHLVLIQ